MENLNYQYFGGLSYCNFILDRSTNYVVHVKLKQEKYYDRCFYFGLLPDSEKDATDWPKGCLHYCEYQEGRGDINTYLKGKAIRTEDSYETRSLEMRINIERQILRVGSLPNCESVVQIDNPKQIEPATPYRFFLCGLNKNTKIIITKLETVSQFNKLM